MQKRFNWYQGINMLHAGVIKGFSHDLDVPQFPDPVWFLKGGVLHYRSNFNDPKTREYPSKRGATEERKPKPIFYEVDYAQKP